MANIGQTTTYGSPASRIRDRERAILRRDYLNEIEGRTTLHNPITASFVQNNRQAPTMGDPYGRAPTLIEAYEREFGTGERLEWQAVQQERALADEQTRAIRDRAVQDMLAGQANQITGATGRTAGMNFEQIEQAARRAAELHTGVRGQTLEPTFGDMEQNARRAGMFNQGVARRVPTRDDQMEAMSKMDNMWKPPEPTLHDLLIRNLPRESIDIIYETGEEYELNMAQSLGFIIDMYRQFTKRGENKVLSGINLELSKLKEESNGRKPDAEEHQQRDEATGAGQERFPPF